MYLSGHRYDHLGITGVNMAKLNVKKRYSIRKSRLSDLRKRLEEEIGESARTYLSGNVEIVETDSEFFIYLSDRKPAVMGMDDWVFPTLRAITGEIREGRPFVIAEEKHGKPLAIAVALMDSDDIMASDTGKVAKNIHFVGDDLWNLEI